jgi:hypothetical protein
MVWRDEDLPSQVISDQRQNCNVAHVLTNDQR